MTAPETITPTGYESRWSYKGITHIITGTSRPELGRERLHAKCGFWFAEELSGFATDTECTDCTGQEQK